MPQHRREQAKMAKRHVGLSDQCREHQSQQPCIAIFKPQKQDGQPHYQKQERVKAEN